MEKKILDGNKICFIVYSDTFNKYSDSRQYILDLETYGMQVEYYTVENAKNKYIDFNQILQISDAKYKVYMSSDCYIINKKFIGGIIALAESNPFIGAVGIVGTVLKTFEHEEMVYGECLVNNLSDGMKKEKYREIEDIYGEVDWLDEKFIITVQDIFWNEEKDHADIIHAMDMREAGYKNIVVRQEKQWVMMEK